jgi:Superfamily II DNA and RNA helicases
MERILQRGGGKSHSASNKSQRQKSLAATRGLILAPTRELAAQCLGMMMAIGKFTDLRAALIVGGAKKCKFASCRIANKAGCGDCYPR